MDDTKRISNGWSVSFERLHEGFAHTYVVRDQDGKHRGSFPDMGDAYVFANQLPVDLGRQILSIAHNHAEAPAYALKLIREEVRSYLGEAG